MDGIHDLGGRAGLGPIGAPLQTADPPGPERPELAKELK
jgi:hypothetical protein